MIGGMDLDHRDKAVIGWMAIYSTAFVVPGAVEFLKSPEPRSSEEFWLFTGVLFVGISISFVLAMFEPYFGRRDRPRDPP